VSITVILASRSPRRIELLGQLGVALEVVPADIDETPLTGELPVRYVERLAREKAGVIAASREGIVLGADTTIDIDNEILGQPVDEYDAARMLRRLSGRTHRVHTGVAVILKGTVQSVVTTTLVTFVPVTDEILGWYLETKEWQGKAGAYAIQGLGATLVDRIQGSYSNVVGLPLRETAQLLGVEPPNEG
jgi:septum formation protein